MTYLDGTDLSQAQLDILLDDSARGLVAAGAGSGKTRLLVAYFVRALLEEQADLGELAAVTFTRKAGSELMERIRRELVRCARPDLARRIDQAAIGTIHGLCSRLLRESPLQAGVDPSFSILEEDAASLVREEVSRKAWEQVVAEAGDGELDAIAARGDRLREQALRLYDRLRGMGEVAPRLRIQSGPSELEARRALLAACNEAVAGIHAHCQLGVALCGDLERIGECLLWLQRRENGLERPVVAATNGFFPSRRTKAAETWLSPVREALIQYRCSLVEEELRPVLEVLNRLLARFHQDYVAFKEARGVLDFADLELKVTAMLLGTESGGRQTPDPTDQPRFVSRLLIDEFQDTNEVQCALLDALGAVRVLMVGDERQSIYRFRGADVDVFRRRKRDSDLGQHRLDTNYRSRPEVLTFVNRVFSSCVFFGSDSFEPLQPGRDLEKEPPAGREPGPDGPGGPTWISEVLVVERPPSPEGEEEGPSFHEAEARTVAARIRRLVDEEGFRQGQIVVLLPVLSNVGLYQQALLAQGLDIYIVRGKGYYSQDEVADVAALLRLLVNPHDDLSLLTVLRSPLVGVSDDCLYLLGRAVHESGARTLWDVVRGGRVAGMPLPDADKLAAFGERLEALRARVGRPGLSQLIDDSMSTCDYDLCLLSAPEGKRRFANVRKLMRMAADFEALEGPDLAGFVSLIGSLNQLGDSEGNAPSLAEGEDVVRIMTVHQAKGLEFPAVFLAGLGSPGRSEIPDEFIIGHDGRVAAIVKERNSTYEECHPHWGPAPDILADEKTREDEEDVRLLYVAMTRAKDRLFLVGARPKGDKMGQARIGRIVAALGLEGFPDPDSFTRLDDVNAAVISVPYAEDEEGDHTGSGPAAETQGTQLGPGVKQAPEPLCFLRLAPPSDVPRQISFSALSAFDRCPQRFHLERVLGLGYLPDTVVREDDGSPANGPEPLLDDVESFAGRDVGLLVHALLQTLDLAGGRPDPASLQELARAEAESAGLAVPMAGILRATDLAGAFWESPLAGLGGLGTALKEESFFFVHKGMTVHGVIDLLIRGDGEWRIVDYKSNTLNGRPAAAVAEEYRLQADVYCLAALRAGAAAVRLEFLFLETPECPVAFEYEACDRDRLERRLEEALAGLEGDSFPARPGGVCSACGVEAFCRALGRPGAEPRGD